MQDVGFSWFENAIGLIPAFERIYKSKAYGSVACKWLLAIYDIRSPYQTSYPIEKDRIEAVNRAYFQKKKIDWEEDPLIQDAMEALRENFYDEDVSELAALNVSIRLEIDALKDAVTPKDRREHAEALKELNLEKTSCLERLLGKIKKGDLDNMQLKNGKKLSHLMKWQEDKKMAEKAAVV